MSTATQEIVRLCEALPAEKRAEVVDFARFLPMRAEHPDDLAWEQRLADSRPLPKLENFLQAAAAEGGEAALDLGRL
jgi:hypothetical protein